MDKKNFINQISALFVIAVITCICFFPVLQGEFTNWDDTLQLLENPDVVGLTFDRLPQIFTSNVCLTYLPLTTLTYAIEYKAFGFNPVIYHLDNLLLHLMLVVALFVLARALNFSRVVSLGASFLFAIHPLHVEAVAWVTSRKDLLFSLFFVLALIFYVLYLKKEKRRFYIVALLMALLSALSKAMALSLPFILCLCDYYLDKRNIKDSLFNKIPFALIVFPLAGITFLLNARVPIIASASALPTYLYTFSFYIKKFFLPLDLTPLYQLPKPISLFSNLTYFSALLVTVAFICVLFLYRKNRLVVFALLWYVFFIFYLVRCDFAVGTTIVADRYMYLPSFGLCLLLVQFLVDRIQYRKKMKVVFISALVFVALMLSFQTYKQTQIWENNYTLWSQVLNYFPDSVIALNNRAEYFLKVQDPSSALNDLVRAKEIDPGYARTFNNLGFVFYQNKQFNPALKNYTRSLQLDAQNYKAFNNRGVLHSKVKNYKLAIADFTDAIALQPKSDVSYLNRGNAYAHLKQELKARSDYQAAIKINPDNAITHYAFGVLHFSLNERAAARASFEEALRLNPGYKNALRGLSMLE